ncbi:hypothetical protein KJ564_13890, partial [bacterium]|nr:hypothetical protein [bacterium]
MYNAPEFVDPYTNDFTLQSTSTMIGAAQSGYDMGAIPFTVRPLMPTDLEITTTPNELDVDLSWVNPTENTDGTIITSITSVKVIRNGETVAELTGSPGAAMQYGETLSIAAECRYMILVETDVDGLYCFTRSAWIGPPAWANPTGPDAYGYTAV